LAKIRIKKFKFIRNIIICVIAIIIVAFILNIAPGYKRDKYTDVVNLILNEKNITENLKNNIYISPKGTIYMSKDDIQNLFDSNIYYDEKYNQIITTSDTKVANIIINDKQMVVNDSTVDMLESVIKINDEIYLPISDMTLVYNIDIKYIESTNRVIIDNLNKGIIKADVSEDTQIKFKPRALSRVVGTLKKGQSVSCFYTTSKGWREIRTEDGIVGYIKANKVTNEYILRQDMEAKKDAQKISIKPNENGEIYVNNEKINLIGLYKTIDTSENNKVWANVSNENLQGAINTLLEDYKTRTIFIDEIVKQATQNKVSNVNIDFSGIENEETLQRLIIELTPKLREVGITTSIVLNDNVTEKNYTKLVEYIVTEK
jgi:hypothetical protein